MIKKSHFLKKKYQDNKIDRLENKDDFMNLLKKIFKIGNRRVLIETGLVFLNHFLNLN